VIALASLVLGLMLGCHSLNFLNRDRPADKKEDRGPAPPCRYTLRIPPCLFFSDVELKREQPIFQELTQLRDQVYKELNLPPSNAVVQVYLFEDRDRYEAYMQRAYPNLPRRRAFFVLNERPFGGQDELLVYTFLGERVQQDLRHELTHALLHSVLKVVPIWLDEGLAEYFELPAGNQGLNPAHTAQLHRELANGAKLDLARLEGLTEVNQMSPAEYREAWAWAHLMLRGKPETRTVLLNYLNLMRDTKSPPPLGPRLVPVLGKPEDALARHLDDLESIRQAATTPR
jgi:hypothetical protein